MIAHKVVVIMPELFDLMPLASVNLQNWFGPRGHKSLST